MAAERLRVRDIRRAFQLHFLEQKSQSQIARSIGCGKSTVRDYLHRGRAAEFKSYSEIEALSDEDLMVRLGFKRLGSIGSMPLRRPEFVMPDWLELHGELSKPSVTLALLWTEYREAHGGQTYSYTQFCEHYNRWSRKLSVVMRQNHKAGEKAFVDYCDGLWLEDHSTGLRHQTQLFVGCLGASSYTFAEASRSQTLPDWISSHTRMWSYFEGVTAITVPDNLRSGVTKPNRYEALINDTYQEMATHYGTCIIPARSRKPKDKGKVEAAVLLAQRWILARLRKRIFTSIAEMNEAISECLETLNNRKMRHLQKSRSELWLEIDKPHLRSLPAKPYEYAEWCDPRVNIDYHVTVNHHFYSVPYQLVQEQVNVRSTATAVEIFYRGKRVASHARSYHRGKATTKSEHMPHSHREHAEWTPSRVISWGKTIGVRTGELIEKILATKVHPEQGFRSALGIIRLEKKYGKERVEKASQRALELGVLNYRFIAEFLKNKMDNFTDGSLSPTENTINDQFITKEQLAALGSENIRGSEYYH